MVAGVVAGVSFSAMAAASLPSGLHTPPLADLVRLFSSATLTGYVRRQEAPLFARETAGCLPFWFDMSRQDHPDAGGVLTPLTRDTVFPRASGGCLIPRRQPHHQRLGASLQHHRNG